MLVPPSHLKLELFDEMLSGQHFSSSSRKGWRNPILRGSVRNANMAAVNLHIPGQMHLLRVEFLPRSRWSKIDKEKMKALVLHPKP